VTEFNVPPKILIADPEPRTVASIFGTESLAELRALGDLAIHADGSRMPPAELERSLEQATIVIGQVDLHVDRLRRMPHLRGVFNVEGNFYPNIDYQYCFENGIHVLNASPVFATPVAESALGMAIDLARGITDVHESFRSGNEEWGPNSNATSFDFTGSKVGIVGLGDLGSALRRMLVPFQCEVKVFDPWLSPRRIREQNCIPSGLDDLLATSQVVFLFAGVTSENANFINAQKLVLIPDGGVVLLMSRASVVDFPALVAEIASGRLRAGIDVFPQEPFGRDEPLRKMKGVILSSHRTGGMRAAFLNIGKLVVADTELLLRGLPPQNCKRAERETVAKMRSRPLAKVLM
jgi:phosphoglycerate dehydrogenase-like enzyme